MALGRSLFPLFATFDEFRKHMSGGMLKQKQLVKKVGKDSYRLMKVLLGNILFFRLMLLPNKLLSRSLYYPMLHPKIQFSFHPLYDLYRLADLFAMPADLNTVGNSNVGSHVRSMSTKTSFILAYYFPLSLSLSFSISVV